MSSPFDVPPPPAPARYSFAPSTLGLAIALPVIDTLVVGLRFAARKKQRVGYELDDWLAVAALVFTWGCAAAIYAGIAKHAVGYPTPDVDLGDGSSTSQVNWAITVVSQVDWSHTLMSIVALGLIKLSFLFLLRRIFCKHVNNKTNIFSAATWSLITLTIIWLVGFLIANMAQCGNHLDALWGPFVDDLKYCHNGYKILLSNSVSDVILDGLVVLLPLPKIWTLQLTVRKKVAVTVVFLFGLLALAGSLTRLVTILQSNSVAADIDENLYITNLIWWTFFEVGIAMLASSLSSLWPLFSDLSGHKIISSVKFSLSTLKTPFARSRKGSYPSRGSSASAIAEKSSGNRKGSLPQQTRTGGAHPNDSLNQIVVTQEFNVERQPHDHV